ncbi:hypothetical protein EZS27_004898 [termite gut metagenome]|uniref:Porin n=1 Tax=termite gut metagenome TaxID=433724 RepID=A0A5J4SN31_9ZZZZ
MRKNLLIFFFILVGLPEVQAQTRSVRQKTFDQPDYDEMQMDPSMMPYQDSDDETRVEVEGLQPKLYKMWNVDDKLGHMIPIPIDTSFHYFQNTNLVEGIKGHYNYLGNLGSARYSRLFFERPEMSVNIFMDPFSSFVRPTNQFKFTNSNVPYTNLSYYKAGGKQDGEELFKAYFSVNANKRLAFGLSVDYLYGRGFYRSQSTAHFNGSFFSSYVGDHYQAHFIYSTNNLKMAENGGIVDDRYVTDPQAMSEGKKEYEATNIPTFLTNTWNKNKDFSVFLTHRYNVGFYRDVEIKKDTISEYVPVTSFIHTIKFEKGQHNFLSNIDPQNYYPETHIDWGKAMSNDSTLYSSIKNTFGIALLEGFNKYAKAGLTAFLSHKMSQYELMATDTAGIRSNHIEQELYAGGELAKRQGEFIRYNATGEVGVSGKAVGQFRLNGDFNLKFRLRHDTVSFTGLVSVTNLLPSFYIRNYHSTHFWWDNANQDKEFRSRLEGELNIEHRKTNLKAGVENIKNYTYFNAEALPIQYNGNIQVASAILNQNFRLGIFHLDNEISWQKSSNSDILPLPDLSLYHNFYIETKLAHNVLSMQLGVDVRYFTKYKALTYTPAIQQFHLQAQTDEEDNRMEIGNYPIVNLYANLHLKRTRIFVMMYHVNEGIIGDSNYFLVPHFPINQRLLKFGLSWNFYD